MVSDRPQRINLTSVGVERAQPPAPPPRQVDETIEVDIKRRQVLSETKKENYFSNSLVAAIIITKKKTSPLKPAAVPVPTPPVQPAPQSAVTTTTMTLPKKQTTTIAKPWNVPISEKPQTAPLAIGPSLTSRLVPDGSAWMGSQLPKISPGKDTMECDAPSFTLGGESLIVGLASRTQGPSRHLFHQWHQSQMICGQRLPRTWC
jgi:hypothetical protein